MTLRDFKKKINDNPWDDASVVLLMQDIPVDDKGIVIGRVVCLEVLIPRLAFKIPEYLLHDKIPASRSDGTI